jgi:hypothetical protein
LSSVPNCPLRERSANFQNCSASAALLFADGMIQTQECLPAAQH